ncbi:hypothetical protein PMAYCL1PPCAC_06696, partial [Pristionchus mayeri]
KQSIKQSQKCEKNVPSSKNSTSYTSKGTFLFNCCTFFEISRVLAIDCCFRRGLRLRLAEVHNSADKLDPAY